LTELSTTPNPSDGDDNFTVTHPYHPLSGHSFPILSQRLAWGEHRVQFLNPETGLVRSLPIVWTDLAPQDTFLHFSQGRAILRLADLRGLAHLLDELDKTLEKTA